MIIKMPPNDSRIGQDVYRLTRTPEGEAFVEWLAQTRLGILESLPCVGEEFRLRQLQGAAQALFDLQLFLTRKP